MKKDLLGFSFCKEDSLEIYFAIYFSNRFGN